MTTVVSPLFNIHELRYASGAILQLGVLHYNAAHARLAILLKTPVRPHHFTKRET